MAQASELTPVFYHPVQTGAGQPFDVWSVRKLHEFASLLDPGRVRSGFGPVGEDELCLAHDRSYVKRVLNLELDNGFGNRDTRLNTAILWSNGSFLAATRYVAQNGGVACSVSQGFHHAGHDYGNGYCTFNGLIVAANVACASRRVLIIDGDAHFGDGTQDCIDRLGLGGRVFNITRGPHIGRPIQRIWRASMWYSWARDLIDVYQPDIIFYQAGADAWVGDPYGCGYLSVDGLRDRDTGVLRACRDTTIGVVWNLAGGYSDRAVSLHHQTLRVNDEVFKCQGQSKKR